MFRRKHSTQPPQKAKPKAASKEPEASRPKLSLLSLESRLMFDAAAAGTEAEVNQEQVAQQQAETAVSGDSGGSDTQASTDSQDLLQAISTFMPNESRTEIVFVDPTVPNYQDLLRGMDSSIEVILLDGGQDGIQQMAGALAGRTGIDAIHLISHGNAGTLQLGTGTLTTESMSGQYADELAAIQRALSEQADILVYGCDFAEGEVGQAAVNQLAALTGADVQASTDLTGNVALGGDWRLEVQTGTIETQVVITDETQMDWIGILAETWMDAATGNVIAGPAGNDWYVGDSANNTPTAAGGGTDFMYGAGGDDTLQGGSGNDILVGGTGNDTIYGNSDDDVILGGTGNDYLDGGSAVGRNTIIGGGGNDQMVGGSGADVFRFTGAQSGDAYTVDGGGATDIIDLSEFSTAAITNSGGVITVDRGGGNVFTITHSNVESIITAATVGNHGPLADAGVDQTVSLSSTVTLTAAGSSDQDGNTLTYQWTQIEGPKVTLSSSTAASPTFTAPSSATTLQFIVVVSDGTTSHADNVTITVAATNAAPTISNLSGDSLAYNEGDGAVVIEQGANAVVADVDSTNLDTGTLTVSIPSGGDSAEDVLSIRNQGTSAGQIGVSGSNITYGGTIIGSFTGGSSGSNLVVTLNSNATPTAVTALVKNITYENTDTAAPTMGARTVRFVLTDGDGGTSASYDTTVTVSSLNDAPTDLSSGIELNTDGGNDAYLISDTGLSQSLTATTVEIRFAATDLPLETVLLSFNNPAGDELSIQLDDPSNNLEIDFGVGTVAYASALNYRAALVDGTVHTLSVTWDSTAGNWSVYIDGGFIESGTGLSAGSPLDTTNGRFVFGQEQDAQNSGYDSTQYFSGTLYDVRIWNDVRTAGEIAQYYQQQLDVTPAEAATVGLVANWQMDGFNGSNQVVEIVTGNNLSIAHAGGAGFAAGAVSSQLSIEENSANGSHIGFVTSEDPDASETFSYSLTDSAGGRFAVNSATGEITVANGTLLDYESATSHSITVRVTDSGGLTYDEVLTVQVNDVEDVPVNTVPGAQTTNEDTTLTFNAANSNLISIGDDAGETLVVTLSVNNGTVTLSGTTGLTFTAGDGTGDATMTFSGTVENINAALDGLQYVPAANYSGSDTFTITSYDQTLYSLDLDANLLAHYTFVGNVNDMAPGTAQNGTLTNGASITTDGTRGQVLTLDGVNDFVDLSVHTADFSGLTQGTIGGWIKATGTFETIFSISDTADTGSYAALFLGASGYLTYEVMENGVMQLAVYKSDVAINDGNWHHVAVAIGPSGNVLYVDGVAATAGQLTYDTGNASTQRFFSSVSGLDSMAIGRNQDSSGGKWYATGSLDDVRLYDRVLTSSEVASLATDLSLTDTDTVSITVNAVNDAPTVTSLSGDSLAYSEGNGAVVIEQGGNALVADVDSTNFDTGTLTVSFAAGSDSAEDVLGIRNQGTSAGQIGVSGATITYGGTIIGTFTGGSSGSNLVITLNSNASPTAVTALIQNITYQNTDTATPTTGARTVRYVLTDGDGGTSANYDTTVTVSGVNDAPVVTTSVGTLAYTENQAATAVDPALTVSDVDNTHLTGATVQINANYVNGQDVLAFTDQLGITGTWNAGNATLTLSGTATVADYQTALRSITYVNTSDAPSTSTRQVSFVVNDGTTNSTIAARNIAVTAVNDVPTITNLSGDSLSYTEGDGAVVIEQGGNALVADVDSTNFDTGTLTVAFTAGSDSVEDVLSIRHQGTGAGQIGVSGATITYGGTIIGTLTGGSSGSNLVITLNSNATPTAVTALVQTITYENTDTTAPTTGARTVRYVLTDGDGGTSANYDTTVTVTAGNDAPTDLSLSADTVAENAANGTVVGTVTGTDPDTGDTQTYSLADTAGGRFAINSSTGQITVADGSLLNYEAATSHNVTVRVTDGGGLTYDETFAINLTNVNEGPSFSNLTATPTYIEGGTAVVLDSDVEVVDPELSAANNFNGATLTLQRNGGTNSQDIFSATGTLSALIDEGSLVVNGIIIGGVLQNANGTLILQFGPNATGALVNQAMQQIAYSNGSDTPPATAQINWTFNDGNSGTQGAGGALTATGSTTVTIIAVNDVPTITNLSGDSLSYTEGDGAVVIEQGGNALVADVDSTNFDTGTLTVSFTAGSDAAEDVLSILNQGTGAGQIGVSGSNITYSGTIIGTFTGGSGSNLVITLNSNATPTAVTALVKNITYENTDTAAPTTGVRTVRYILTDGDGGTSANYDTTVAVSAVNDAPVLTFGEGDKNFTEGALAVMIDALPNVSDLDSTNFDTGTLTITISANPSVDDRVELLNTGMGAGQIGVSGTNVYYGGTLIGTQAGGIGAVPFVVTFNANADASTVGEVMANIRFWVAGDTPSTATRTVEAVLTDGDGGTSLTASKQITVTAANDAPVLDLDVDNSSGATGADYQAAFAEGGGPVSLVDSTDALLSDVDSGNLTGLTVTLSNQLDGTSEVLSADTTGTVIVAVYDSGTGVLTLSGSDTVAHYQQVLRTIQYNNTSNSPDLTSRILYIVAEDGVTYSNTSTVTVTMTAANDAPTDLSLSANTVTENATNGTIVGTVTGTDPDTGDTQTYSLTDSAGGRFAINSATGQITVADGSLLNYEAAASHSVTVRVTDSGGLTYDETFTINLTDVNEAPTGADATITITEDSAHTLTTANFGFSDVDVGDSLIAVRIDTLPTAGSLTLSGVAVTAGQVILVSDITAGNLVFTPTADANGTGYATVTFSVRDSGGLYDSGPNTLTFDVTPVNDAPVNTVPGAQTVAEDTSLPLSGISVTDLDGNLSTVQLAVSNGTLSVTLSGSATISAGANGTGTLTLSGSQVDINATLASLSYQGTANYTGSDTLTITSTDSNAVTDVDTVAITVTAVNDATVVTGGTSGSGSEDTVLTGTLTATDAEGLSDGTVFSVSTPATSGTASIDPATGLWSYTPNADWNGSDSFTVTITDDAGNSSTQVIGVTVTPVNDAPSLVTNTGSTVAEGGTDTIDASELAVTDLDNSAAQLTYTIGTGPVFGRLELTTAPGVAATTFTQADIAANRLIYIHNGSETTSDSFSFAVNDGAGGSVGTTTVTLTITPVNDTPTITSGGGGATAAFNVVENVSAVTIVTGADVDLPVQALSYSLAGGADQALFMINAATGVLSFTAPPDFEVATDANGDNVYVVQVQVMDSQGASTLQTIQVTVTDVLESAPPPPPPDPAVPPVLVSPLPLPGGATPGPGTPPPVAPVTPLPTGAGLAPVPPGPTVLPMDSRPISESSLTLVPPPDRPAAKQLEEPKRLIDDITKEIPLFIVNDEQGRPLFTVLPVEPTPTLEPDPPERTPSVSDLLMTKLDEMTVSLEQAVTVSEARHELMARVAAVTGTTLSVGFVAWALRSGAILASCLATMPAWRHFDPLPVVKLTRSERKLRRDTAAQAQQQEAAEFKGLTRVLDAKLPLKRSA
jgi:hypothetical protein